MLSNDGLFNEQFNSLKVDENNMNTKSKAGRCFIALNEPTMENIQRLNFLSLFFCWFSPFTGIFALIYSRRIKNYANNDNMSKAKEYMERANFLVLLTVVIGALVLFMLTVMLYIIFPFAMIP
jgi:hypothetical protein